MDPGQSEFQLRVPNQTGFIAFFFFFKEKYIMLFVYFRENERTKKYPNPPFQGARWWRWFMDVPLKVFLGCYVR